MSIKPTIEEAKISTLIHQIFDAPVDDLAPLGTGQMALVYKFSLAAQAYVIRFVENQMAHTLTKEIEIGKLLHSSGVPLPPILHEGSFENYHFAIAPFSPGKILDALTPKEYAHSLPEIIKTLDIIHQVDVSSTTGFGAFYETAVGPFATWQDCLLSVGEEEEFGFFGKWHSLFEETFLERWV